MLETDWQPAVIASKEHVLRFHTIDPGAVSKFGPQYGETWLAAPQLIRIRLSKDVKESIAAEHRLYLGCRADRFFEVHPKDARRLWPELDTDNVGLCEHQIMTD